ncbi:cation:proton antiporter [Agromyces sp. ZXT2-6]|uniref:cation:proton antiporter n=1 Tax=Agromyces sp. ZXT2-6 TaxID=3461153 RepID=UPI004054A92B
MRARTRRRGLRVEVDLSTLVLIPAIAAVAPLATRAVGRWVAIPLVVFEILLGLLLGPAVLDWVQEDAFIALFADFGLAMLFYLAGREIDFQAIRGAPIMRAGAGWAVSMALALGLAFLIEPGAGAVFVAVALASTALGALLPILRDAGLLRTRFGVSILAVGAVGEFAPLLAITLFLSGQTPLHATVVLLGFAVVTGVLMFSAFRGDGARLHRAIEASLHTSGQFVVRLVMFVLLSLVALSIFLGIDMLLGAFAAGVLGKLLLQGASEREAEVTEAKIEAVGFGLLVPVFFINTGITFDLQALVSDARTLLLLPLFTVLLLFTRGIPAALLAPRGSTARERVSTGFFAATGLPIIVAVTALGVDAGALDSGMAAALVGAGLLSMLLYPLIALTVRTGNPRRPRQESNLRPRD